MKNITISFSNSKMLSNKLFGASYPSTSPREQIRSECIRACGPLLLEEAVGWLPRRDRPLSLCGPHASRVEHLTLTSLFLLAKHQSDILTFKVVRLVSWLWKTCSLSSCGIHELCLQGMNESFCSH
jgi:hypothetical protein